MIGRQDDRSRGWAILCAWIAESFSLQRTGLKGKSSLVNQYSIS